ncbi:MAG: TetR/AcrR family transcriptional regulator [Clostridia bacterium]|nr:TetR/AcrR family transcriptional regulator [Clostridia bacterium]
MAEPSNESRRVKYTKKVIRDSFFELLAVYPINRITVKMISEKADVNRGTFYAYYKDAYDLLEKTENALYAIIKEQFKDYSYDGHTRDALLGVLEHLEKNIEVCRVLFGKNGDRDFMKKLLYIVHDQTIEFWNELYPDTGVHILELTYSYLVAGSSGVITDWIFDDAGITAEQLTDYLFGMWNNGLTSLKSN